MIEPTVEKAKQILDEYDNQRTKANLALISGIQYDGMPKGSPKGNAAINAMVNRASAETYCKKIKTAIKLISEDNEDYGKCLNGLYIKHKTTVALAMEMSVSRTTIFRIKQRALLEFAKIMPEDMLKVVEKTA